ncbi:MAG TPA: chemotaxis protein CheB [Caulobacteraceae bacterium]|nr:chemotaxis protein CheB [Caulobacteraceae bacterium]
MAIAGSTGSIDALRSILSRLPPKFPAPIFVVVHVGARGRNVLADIFGRAGELPVATAEDGEPAQPGHVYVAPADQHLLAVDGCCRLGRGPRENMSRPAIDPLFRSVGLAYGAGAIGVLLSGYMNDGAAGLADLKRCGGQTVVQNPGDAEAPEMPLAALRSNDIDFRAPANDLAELLVRLLAAEPQAASEAWDDVALEVEIALGRPVDSRLLEQIAAPSTIPCPACGGVLSQIRRTPPLRYRCQVGHAYTGEILAKEQDDGLDEAVRVALRIVEERATLMDKLADDASSNGRRVSSTEFQRRSEEFRGYADTLRRAALKH